MNQKSEEAKFTSACERDGITTLAWKDVKHSWSKQVRGMIHH